MTAKRKIQLSVILIILFGLGYVFYEYCSIVWHPVLLKIVGKKSAEQAIRKIEKPVQKRLKEAAGFELNQASGGKLVMIVLKEESILEIWSVVDGKNKLLKTYPLTGLSGKLGPKLRRGDWQIPEGLYKISYLNPNSRYHLSLKINYPNEFDKSNAKIDGRDDLGDNIMIHGGSRTIGCIPVGDPAIEEIFYMAYKAGIENCNVIIAPHDFRNNSEFPVIEPILWENDLYAEILSEITKYK